MDPRDLSAALGADGEGVLLRVHVQPNASRSEVVGLHGDALKLRVATPPESGRANDAVVELVAATLGIRTHDVTLVRGARSRAKTLRVTGLAARGT